MLVAGQERTFLHLKFPFVDDSGETSGITGISTDITSKRLAESLREELTTAEAGAIEDLRASRQETVERLALAIETHDADTGLHVARMASIAAFLGAKLGFDEDQVLLLRAAAPMHDVGKIATPDGHPPQAGPVDGRGARGDGAPHDLRLPDPRRLQERAAADGGDDRPHPSRALGRRADTRTDSRASEIPLEGRVAAVADVFDALLSDRCLPTGDVGGRRGGR